MSPYRRNLLVGVTVLAALVALAWMMVRFGGALARPFAPQDMPIAVRADRADGLFEGSAVLFLGVTVGQITRVERDPAELAVLISAQVRRSPPLPANIHGVIRSQVFGGASVLHLELDNAQPVGQLAEETVLPGEFVGVDLLPPEFAELARELRDAAKQFRETNLLVHLDEEVRRVGKVIDSIDQLVSDPKMREDLQASLANIRSTTERADRIAQQLESLSSDASETLEQAKGAIGRTETELTSVSRQIGDRLTQVARLVDQFQEITRKIEAGEGTAGQIVNDPRLYEAMVDTAREMNATVTDLRRLVQQWEEEGVRLRLR